VNVALVGYGGGRKGCRAAHPYAQVCGSDWYVCCWNDFGKPEVLEENAVPVAQ